MPSLQVLTAWARRVKRDAVALWFACRDPRTPRLAKWLCVAVVAYALSPIDLIPDFIPVLGYVDDALLLPSLIWLAVRLVPDDVMARCRVQADDWIAQRGRRPKSYAGAVAIVALWLLLAWGAWLLLRR